MNDFYDGEEIVEEKIVNSKSKESENDIPVRWKEATMQMVYCYLLTNKPCITNFWLVQL